MVCCIVGGTSVTQDVCAGGWLLACVALFGKLTLRRLMWCLVYCEIVAVYCEMMVVSMGTVCD